MINLLLIAALVWGLIYGNEGAANVAVFLGWAIFICHIVVVGDAWELRMAKKRFNNPVLFKLKTEFKLVTIFVGVFTFIWYGYFVTGFVLSIGWVCLYGAYEKSKLIENNI
jgi:hypothetical protein